MTLHRSFSSPFSTLFLFLLIFSMLLPGCQQEKKYRIGVSQCSDDDWRQKMNGEIYREMLLHEEADVEIRSANDDSRRQIADIRYFMDNDFDIIIAAPNEAKSLTPILTEAYKKGVPVLLFDRSVDGNEYTARIEADNEELGHSAAEYALLTAGTSPKAIEIRGLDGSTPAIKRHDGFRQRFTEGGGSVVASIAGNWTQELAEKRMDSLLAAHPETNIIFAHNDRMAIGASNAARKLGRHDVKIIGVDGAPEIGVKAVADSVIDATFLYPTEGHLIVQTALKILRGEPVNREIMLPASSAVDRSNADILLLQNRTLNAETERMMGMKTKIDDFWARHSAQTSLFYASVAILILLFILIFVMLKSFWTQRRHQQTLLEKNRQLEEERDKQKELNDKLEEATQSKLVFFTNVSHDLRTPLTLISEPVARLAAADNLTPQQHSLIRLADKNVRILHRLINQILDFRKYENGRLALNPSEVDFRSVIHDWMDSFYSHADKRNIRLSLDEPTGGAPILLAIDAEKMERVFFNLLSNAFKHTPEGGEITVRISVDTKNLTMEVSDTGEGIPEEDMDKIFERFYQVDRVHPHGSGIGLSLSKAFIEMHGGTIQAESTPGKGSVFTVRLPLTHVSAAVTPLEKKISESDASAELEPTDSTPTFESDRQLILIIDDNRDIRRLVTELLADEYNVVTASSGSEGIQAAIKYVPDLIICDVMMPGMDGFECCHTLKENMVTSHIPVLMLTACSLDEQKVQGYRSGADGYLSKPFSTEVLKARCENLIVNRKRIRELWMANPSLPSREPSTSSSMDPTTPASPSSSSTDGGAESLKIQHTSPLPDIDNEFYNHFLTCFHKEIDNPELTVDIMAGHMGLERTQFYRKIKALTGYSPVELIRLLRLHEARHILLTTDKTISEAAYSVGFSTPAYFTKCYRDAFGITPSETRAAASK